jgi:hypothetical protein
MAYVRMVCGCAKEGGHYLRVYTIDVHAILGMSDRGCGACLVSP